MSRYAVYPAADVSRDRTVKQGSSSRRVEEQCALKDARDKAEEKTRVTQEEFPFYPLV